MKNWSLNAKFILVVVFLMAAGAVTGWFGVNRIGLLNERIDSIVKVNVPRIQHNNEVRDYLRHIAVYERNLILETNLEELERIDSELNRVKKELETHWSRAFELATETGKQRLNAFKAAFDKYWDAVQESKSHAMKNDSKKAYDISSKKGTPLRLEAAKIIAEILDLNQKILKQEEVATDEVYAHAGRLMYFVIVASACAGGILTVFVLRSLNRAIDRVISSLSTASEQVAKTSQQIAAASEQLSQASSEQAASLQETSSSLEELTSMVAKNSESAKSAAHNADESLASAETGKTTIHGMVEAIRDLEKANQEIAEIEKVFSEIQEKTKVIEDIVFQTQLLSFNASVEAARAGEHGKGFAVVAEEVGSLAEMSGNASNEISSLLENSLKQVEHTVEDIRGRIGRLVAEGSAGMNALETIVVGAQASTSKANEIATASHEQSRGIQEINRAMTQLDQTTQQNAATSEEAASAAEELSGQAAALKSTVDDLVHVIKGSAA